MLIVGLVVHVAPAVGQEDNGPLIFSVFADTPYTSCQLDSLQSEVDPASCLSDDPAISSVADHNGFANSEFIIHLGDMKSSSGNCVENLYTDVRDAFSASRMPVFFVIGDNDWNDCDDPDEGRSFWETHLASFEERFDCSSELNVERQEGGTGNFAFVRKGVLIIGLMLPGGGPADYSQSFWQSVFLDDAKWAQQQFEAHRDSVRAAVVCAHAHPDNPHGSGLDRLEEDYFILDPDPSDEFDGFLAAVTAFIGSGNDVKPVSYLFCDNHGTLNINNSPEILVEEHFGGVVHMKRVRVTAPGTDNVHAAAVPTIVTVLEAPPPGQPEEDMMQFIESPRELSASASGAGVDPEVLPLNETTVRIRWNTTDMLESYVRYGTSQCLLSESVYDAVPKQSHDLLLTGLCPGQAYEFTIGDFSVNLFDSSGEYLQGLLSAGPKVDGDADELVCDNCPEDANPDQSDVDTDGAGDVCDNCPEESNADQSDGDTDGVGDACDNCPESANADQSDGDTDGVGDACDNCPGDSNADQSDVDTDGVGDACDNCPESANVEQSDGDTDGVGDVCDNCPESANAEQSDGDTDGVGDVCDNCPGDSNVDQSDVDTDGVGDVCDNCPGNSNAEQSDVDTDGVGEVCDNCPEIANQGQDDSDSDGPGDVCDNCPGDANADQTDTNENGIGDACEATVAFIRSDANRDGVVDLSDPVTTLGVLFQGGTLGCRAAADANDDEEVNIADALWTMEFLFLGGPSPPPPFPLPGLGTTPGPLFCER